MSRLKSQRGDTFIMIMVVIALIGLAMVVMSTLEHKTYSRWESDCRTSNGLVVKTAEYRYERYVNGKKAALPGWENE